MLIEDTFTIRQTHSGDRFEVGRETLRQFARAVGEEHPACHDAAAAQASGYRDIVAPPTYLVSLTMRHEAAAAAAAFGAIDMADIVHRDQSFRHHRTVHPGDRLLVETVLTSRDIDGRRMLSLRTTVHDQADELVSDVTSTMVHTPPVQAGVA